MTLSRLCTLTALRLSCRYFCPPVGRPAANDNAPACDPALHRAALLQEELQ